jgi:hypothetical protein
MELCHCQVQDLGSWAAERVTLGANMPPVEEDELGFFQMAAEGCQTFS